MEGQTELVNKIASCHGKLTGASTARVLKCSKGYVYSVWKFFGKVNDKKEHPRSLTHYVNKIKKKYK